VEKGADLGELKYRLEFKLRTMGPVYMRMGLSRPFYNEKDGDNKKKCYVQIIGLHTFPDYMNPPVQLPF